MTHSTAKGSPQIEIPLSWNTVPPPLPRLMAVGGVGLSQKDCNGGPLHNIATLQAAQMGRGGGVCVCVKQVAKHARGSALQVRVSGKHIDDGVWQGGLHEFQQVGKGEAVRQGLQQQQRCTLVQHK